MKNAKVLLNENKQLKKQLYLLRMAHKNIVHNYSGESIKLGIVSDTHMSSLYERNDFLHLAYTIFEQEGISAVYHSGDILAGENMYRGQVYELYKHGAKAQINWCIQKYPKSNLKTYFITGN